MATCGVWMTARRLVAVVVDEDGIVRGSRAAHRDDSARWDLVSHIEAEHGLDVMFVVTQTLLASDALPRLAVQRGAQVRVAPDELIGFACRLVGHRRRGTPAALAGLLARMALAKPFAERLVRFELQLPLL